MEFVGGGKTENFVLFHDCHLLLCISASSLVVFLGFCFVSFGFFDFFGLISLCTYPQQR